MFDVLIIYYYIFYVQNKIAVGIGMYINYKVKYLIVQLIS